MLLRHQTMNSIILLLALKLKLPFECWNASALLTYASMGVRLRVATFSRAVRWPFMRIQWSCVLFVALSVSMSGFEICSELYRLETDII